jgi:hypothetical protein
VGNHRLYEGVVRSRVLYGAPVWAQDLIASRRSLIILRRLQRTTDIRIARGYRTISYRSATVLAAPPPFRAAGPCTPTGVRTPKGPAPMTTRPTASRLRTSGKRRSWRSGSDDALGWSRRTLCGYTRSFALYFPTGEDWRDQGGVPLTFRMM